MRVVADTGDLLALHLAEGTPLEFPAHPFGPHPWSFTDHWRETDVLQLHRPGDGYSVWAGVVVMVGRLVGLAATPLTRRVVLLSRPYYSSG